MRKRLTGTKRGSKRRISGPKGEAVRRGEYLDLRGSNRRRRIFGPKRGSKTKRGRQSRRRRIFGPKRDQVGGGDNM